MYERIRKADLAAEERLGLDAAARRAAVSGAAWGPADLLWERFLERGRAAFDGGQDAAAEGFWNAALDLSDRFEAADPRRAASLVAAAAVRRARDAGAEAEELLRQARESWKGSVAWAARLRPALRARSSTFHLRLETRHRASYERLAREACVRKLGAGLGTALNNLAELLDHGGRRAEAEALYSEALRARAAALGSHEAGVAVILANLAGLFEATGHREEARIFHARARAIETEGPRAGLARWLSERPGTLSDERRLEAALWLPPLLRRTG